MSKILVIDPRRCTGCRLCEIVCSVTKEGVSDPALSRIQICELEAEKQYLPLVCHQCEDPLCATVCPVNGIARDEDLDRVTADAERCVTCRACIAACPHGGLHFDAQARRILRCDLCGGDPACASVCDSGALAYLERDVVERRKKRDAAREMCRLAGLG